MRFGIASQIFQSILQSRLGAQGLTPAQLTVLAHLSRQSQPQRVTDIARVVDVGQPAVTKMLAKFEGAGWIKNVAGTEDRRSKSAQITDKGRAHFTAVQRGLIPELPEFLARLEDAELERFTEDLRLFGNFLDDCRRLDEPGGTPSKSDKN